MVKENTEKYCQRCKTGKKHEENTLRVKAKEINRRTYYAREKTLGATCVSCMFNPVSRRKGKAIKKVYKNFKAFDNFEPIDGE